MDPLNQMRQEMGELPADSAHTAARREPEPPTRPTPRPPQQSRPQFRNVLVLFILLATIVIVAVVATSGGSTTKEGEPTTSASAVPVAPESSPPIPVDGPIHPVDVAADSNAEPSEDDSGNPVTYVAANLIDGDLTTCWRTNGAAIDVSIPFNLGGLSQVTAVGLVPGYAKVDPVTGKDRFTQNRRVLQVTWSADDGNAVSQDLTDSPVMQAIPVAWITTGVVMTIRQVTSPGDRDYTAVSEVAFTGHRA